jgi:Phosphotransferase system, mannose/fructose/N-acetylgalactosamine-specific component IIB
MAEIVLSRIDNRLVHGQVGVTWVNSLNVDTIVVVDDETYYDRFSQKLMESVAKSSSVNIRFYKSDDFIKRFLEVDSNQKIFLVVKTPKVIRQLYEHGLPIDKVNLGNMHYERGKVMVTRKVYVDEHDIDNLEYLLQEGVYIYYQDVPGSPRERIHEIKVK